MTSEVTHPLFSVIISTRNRGDTVKMAIDTILKNDYPAFELLVVDQSTNEETATAVAPFLHDSRLKFIRTDTVGVSRGQNLALAQAQGELVAITDDDCEAPRDWLTNLRAIFERNPAVALVYFDVLAGPHDQKRGFVPDIDIGDTIVLKTLKDCGRRLGMGAGMALRREPIMAFGGFDEHMGPGGMLRSGADQDIAIRTIINGWYVLMTNETYVTHYGFRDWEQTKPLVARYAFGGGAICAKPLKTGHYGILYHMAHRVFIDALWLPFARIFDGKRPQGFKRFFYFWQGFSQGLKTPVNESQLRYAEE